MAVILVVDDNRISRELIHRRLIREGYEVVVAEDGRRALEMLDFHPVEFLLLDLQMPQLTGMEVLVQLRSQRGLLELPVIILSANEELPSKVAAIEAGANDYLCKPVPFALLLAKMRQLLSLRRAPSPAAPTLQELPNSDFVASPGKMLAHYQLHESLGQGGMGEVFRALDTRLLRSVAVKVILAEPEPGVGLQRFLTEARALARVDHPGVVRIYEIGLEPCRFLAMELVEGTSLHEVPPDPRHYLQLLDALEACHLQGVVHRDLKPRNLMLTSDGRLKVMDFGLARAGDQDPLPGDGIYGTPEYLAPEAFDRSLGRVDAQSDLFVVGIMLYQALSGRHPFAAETLSELVNSLLWDTPPPIEGLDPALQEVVDRALLRDKRLRFATAREFYQSLSRCLS